MYCNVDLNTELNHRIEKKSLPMATKLARGKNCNRYLDCQLLAVSSARLVRKCTVMARTTRNLSLLTQVRLLNLAKTTTLSSTQIR